MADFTKSELKRAKQAKEEELYQKEGYKKAVILGRSFLDYENHLFAFLIDLNICLIPVYVWGVEFILILSGVIPPAYFDLLFYLMYALLFMTSCILLPLYTAKTGGYSWGGRYMGLRLVRPNRKPAPVIRLVLRQLFGFGIPMMLFGYFFSAFGIAGWWLLSGLITLISPGQRSLADWIFGLVLVYTPRYELKVRQSKKIASPQENQKQQKQEDQRPREVEPVTSALAQEEADFTFPTSADLENQSTPSSSLKFTSSTANKRMSPQEIIQTEYPMPIESSSSFDSENLPLSKVDLHIRSDYSDDSDADIEDIIIKAKKLGLTCISITDHNNARSSEQAIPFAMHHGLKFIPGVEVDCEIFGERVRILGYYINWKLDDFVLMENASLERERNVSEQRIALFEKVLGIKFNTEALMANSRFKIVRPHELTNLVFDTQSTRQLPILVEYLQKYPTEEQARKQFSRDFFGPGGSCEVVASYPSAESVIALIRDQAGGIPILAGWHLDQISDDTIEGLIDAGIQGFEVFTPSNSRQTKAFLMTLAKNENLYVTGGSDYHGTLKSDRFLGYTTASGQADQILETFTKGLGEDEGEILS